MRKTLAAALALVAAVFLSSAQTEASPWKVDKRHSFIHFEVTHLGIFPFPGRFKQHAIDLDYNPDAIASSKVRVRIPVDSVETDDGLMNEILLGDQFFDENNYPSIEFVSTAVRQTGPTTGEIDGELTIIGNTRPVTMQATFNGQANDPFTGRKIIAITASTVFDRTQWGLSAWQPFVGSMITIEIGFEASPE